MKKTLIIRILVCVMILAMVIPMVACNEEEPNQPDDTTAPADTGSGNKPSDSVSDTDIQIVPDSLDYNGSKVTILYWSDAEHNEFDVEGLSGDDVEDALFTRNNNVEQKLNVELNWIGVDGDAGEMQTYLDAMKSIHDGNETENYTMFATYSRTAGSAAVKGYCKDLNSDDCEYLDFSYEWWPDRLIEQATFGDHMYFASGDISANALYMMYVCYVNTEMLTTYNLENPQKYVTAGAKGEWTYDKFFTMCENIWADADGSGGKSVGDQFGYMTRTIHGDPWFYGTGAVLVEYDDNDKLQIASSMSSDAVVDTIEKLQNLFYVSKDGMYTSDKVYHQTEFGAGRLLFMTDRARVSFKVLATDDYADTDYVLVPCPKYSNDGDYVTVIGNPFTLYGLFARASEKDTEMGAAVMAYYAYESHITVTPAVYDKTLKTKYVSDATSREMLDIVRTNMDFDIGRILHSEINGPMNWFQSAIGSDTNSNWKTLVKTKSKVVNNTLEKVQNALEKD